MMKVQAAFLCSGLFWALLLQGCHGLDKGCNADDVATIQDDIEEEPASASKICFPVEEKERCFYLLLPECAKENPNVPLVVDIHDTGSCPIAQSRLSGWKEYAMKECFAVAWPLGTTDPNIVDEPCFTVPGGIEVMNSYGHTLGVAPDCCCKKDGKFISESETNDIQFIHDLIPRAIDEAWYNGINVNATRVQLSGFGNGATAAMGFAAIHSDIVACLSPFAGTMVTAFTEDYNPVPVFSVLDSGSSRGDTELSLDDIVSPSIKNATSSYILPSPSRVDGSFSSANRCGEASSRSNVAKDQITKVEGTVTGGKFADCDAPVNFLKPPFAAYKMRNIQAETNEPVNRVVDTTGLAYLFCKERQSIHTNYVRGEQDSSGAVATVSAIFHELVLTGTLLALLAM